MLIGLSDLEGHGKVSSSLLRIKPVQNKRAEKLGLLRRVWLIFLSTLEHGGRTKEWTVSCLFPLHLWHLAPAGGGSAINPTLTLMWQISQVFWLAQLENEHCFTLAFQTEQAHTITSQEREKSLFLSLSHCPNWPSLGTLPLENHSTTDNAILLW